MNITNSLNAILVRHGQTTANRDGIVQGQLDTPLTEDGMASTVLKARKLVNFTFDAVYCSDLGRAKATLEIIARHVDGLPKAVYRADLREIDFGELSGKPKEEIMDTVLYHKANPRLRYPGGEGGDDLMSRVRGFFAHADRKHGGCTILVVSHYGIMETAARLFTGHPHDNPVIIGSDDVWRMIFTHGGTRATLEVL